MRNEVAKQILSCKSGKDGVRKLVDGLNASLTSGRTSAYIGTKWNKDNPLFNAMTDVKVGKIIYSTQEIDDSVATAKQWDKTSAVAKSIQQLNVTPVSITTQYVYKSLDIAQEDIDDLNESGEYAVFEEFATNELRQHVEDYVIGNVIGGKFTSTYSGTSLYRFMVSEVSSVFTTVTTKTQDAASDYSYVTLANVTDICNDVDSDHKWLVVHPDDLASLIAEATELNPLADRYAVAAHVGVNFIYSTRLALRGKVICLDPAEFWKREKNEIEIAYPVYDYNKLNMLYEKNIGIRPHRPLCSSMLVGSLIS